MLFSSSCAHTPACLFRLLLSSLLVRNLQTSVCFRGPGKSDPEKAAVSLMFVSASLSSKGERSVSCWGRLALLQALQGTPAPTSPYAPLPVSLLVCLIKARGNFAGAVSPAGAVRVGARVDPGGCEFSASFRRKKVNINFRA